MRRSIYLVDLMMPTLKIAASLAIVAMVGVCHAQEHTPLMPMGKAAVVAAQTSSPTNYVLLEPIANRPVKRSFGSPGLLAPMQTVQTDVATDKIGIKASSNARILVTPMSFKRGIFDEHQFKVHNVSNQALREARILLTAPVGSVVQQVSPKPDSVDGGSIMLTVEQIGPGEHKVIEVSINYPRNEFAKFESMVITEKWGQNSYAGKTEAEPEKEDSEAESNLMAEMLQPKSTGSLEPILRQQAPETSRAKVPVIMASTIVKPVQRQDSVSSQTTKTETVENPTSADKVDSSIVTSRLQGPTEVVAGQVNDYSIDIENLSSGVVGDVIVQLSIPQNMKVTLLDRDAWYDAENRKISWQLDRIDGQALETIRYKAVVKESCSTEQMIVVGMNSSVQSTTSLKTIAR